MDKNNAYDISKTGDPYVICDFAENESADTWENMKMLERGLFTKKFTEFMNKRDTSFYMHIYEFLFCMVDSGKENIDVDEIVCELVEVSKPKLSFYIAAYVESDKVDIEMLKDFVIGSKCAKYIKKWIEHFGTDERLEKALLEAKKEKYVPKILEKYKGMSVSEIQAEALESNDPNLICEIAEHVDGVNVSALFDRMIELDDMLWVYEYMASVDNLSQIKKSEGVEFTLKKKMPKFMTYVAEYCGVSDNDFDKLHKGVKKFGNEKYIEKIEAAKVEREKEKEAGKDDK